MQLSLSVELDDDVSPYEVGCAMVAAAQEANRVLTMKGKELAVDESIHLEVEAPKAWRGEMFRTA